MVNVRRLLAYCRPRPSALARHPDGGWRLAEAEPGVRIVARHNVTIGPGTRLQRGATIYGHGTIRLGAGGLIGQWSIVNAAGGSIVMGDRSSIGDHCNLYGQGGLTIGTDVIGGSGIRIMTANHIFDRRDIAIYPQGERPAAVVIHDRVWLAANVVILPGVTIGEGAVIAAGAVVTRDIPAFTIAAGVPAAVIRERP